MRKPPLVAVALALALILPVGVAAEDIKVSSVPSPGGAARAIRCARAIIGTAQRLGISVRAGLHTGEVEAMGDRISGICVHIGARVAAMAGAGEVLVTGTVKDVVTGSGIQFGDRGRHELRGVPGQWQLFAVEPS